MKNISKTRKMLINKQKKYLIFVYSWIYNDLQHLPIC
jgi:hypothetical protein